MTKLHNLSVSIVVSDPWEFGTECGPGPFAGTIADATAEKLLVRLVNSIPYQGKMLYVAVTQCRHAGDALDNIGQKRMHVNVLLLPSKVETVAQLEPTNIRDGVAVIGTIELLSVQPN